MIEIEPLGAFQDNYIWLIHHDSGRATVVDPGDARVVARALEERGLQLASILVTHGHWDHVDGITALAGDGIAVFGPASERIPGLTHPVRDGDTIGLGGASLQVLEVPGHTPGHVAYHGFGALFSGDTLFGAGCGRLLGGTAEQLFHSLQRLAALPGETRLHCAHEYTVANLRFARTVEPENAAIEQRLARAEALQAQGRPTLPSTLEEERQTNPFLRCHLPPIQEAVARHDGGPITPEVETFRRLRAWKDHF